jgi:hypothetical protein
MDGASQDRLRNTGVHAAINIFYLGWVGIVWVGIGVLREERIKE